MPDRPEHAFETRLASAWPVVKWRDVTVLLAVSGGPDSISMLHGIHQLRMRHPTACGRIEIAHFNHGWRPQDARLDEQLVADTCRRLRLTLHRAHSSAPTENEQDARDERYEFLIRTARTHGARYVATAHTCDDQAETILHRIVRGTGLQGLSGIRSRRGIDEAVTLVRPLLWARRRDVLGYLHELDLDYREDATNQDCRYTRNRIRHELLPYLSEQFNPEVVKSLVQLGQLAEEAHGFIRRAVQEQLDGCVQHQNASQVVLCSKKLRALSSFLRREVLKQIWQDQGWPQQAMTFAHWNGLAERALRAGSTTLPGGIQAMNDEVQFVLADGFQSTSEAPAGSDPPCSI